MSTEKKSFVYVKGDASKKEVDPKTQQGKELVLVLASGKEIALKEGFRPVDEAAVANRKLTLGPAEDAALEADKAKAKAKDKE